MLADYDPERIHQRIHAGHNWVIPQERFVTPELIDATCIVGTANEVIERLQQLEEQGLDQLMILPNFDQDLKFLNELVGKLFLTFRRPCPPEIVFSHLGVSLERRYSSGPRATPDLESFYEQRLSSHRS